MILALRQRHRRVFAVLGIALPVAFIVGVAARKPVPSVGVLPSELANVTGKFSSRVWERADLFAKTSIQVRLLREQAGGGRFAVSFSAAKDFVKPDLLVYWVAGNPTVSDKLPENAALLGAFGSSAVALPTEAAIAEGVLVLFSLADQEIVEASRPFVAANLSSRQISPSQADSGNSRLNTSVSTNK